MNNPKFNSIEFDGIRNKAGLNSFSLTPKRWIALTGAVGIVSKAGRYGGTFAYRDIAFEFAAWISIEFKFYLIVIVETKGLANLDVPLKIQRLRQWCEDINALPSDVIYDFVYVDQESFEKYAPKSFAEVLTGFRQYKET